MGDNDTAHAIRRAARTMSKAASVMRIGAKPGGDTAALATILRSCPTFDHDDWEMLALLVEGELCRADGDRSTSYKPTMMREAEAAAREWKKQNGSTLTVACEAVAPGFAGLAASTLFNYVRRGRKGK